MEKYHGQLMKLPLLSFAPGLAGLRLNVRSQGCLEGVLCYPPTSQIVLVGLPADSGGGAVEDPAGLAPESDNPASNALPGEEQQQLLPSPCRVLAMDVALPASRGQPLAELETASVRRLRRWMQTVHSCTKPSD